MQAQRNEDRTDTHWSKQANRRTNRDIDRRRKRHAETDYNNKDYNNKKTERRERSWQQTDPSKDPRTDEDFSECTDCQTDVDTQTEMLWREVTGQRGRRYTEMLWREVTGQRLSLIHISEPTRQS